MSRGVSNPPQSPPRRSRHSPPAAPPASTASPLPKTLLGSAEVAELLGVTSEQLRKMSKRGQFLPGRKLPGLGLRWHRETVREWMDQAGGRAS